MQARLSRLANDKGVDFSTLVNNMLRKDIELIEMAKYSGENNPLKIRKYKSGKHGASL